MEEASNGVMSNLRKAATEGLMMKVIDHSSDDDSEHQSVIAEMDDVFDGVADDAADDKVDDAVQVEETYMEKEGRLQEEYAVFLAQWGRSGDRFSEALQRKHWKFLKAFKVAGQAIVQD